MSSATSKKNVRSLRRRRFAATRTYGVHTVPDLMAQLREGEIRARIKQARKDAGLSQTEMAALLAVIPRTVQNYENDHVPWSRIGDIADITGTSARWLLHGELPAEDEAPQQERVVSQLKRIEQALVTVIELLTGRLDPRAVEAASALEELAAGLHDLAEPQTTTADPLPTTARAGRARSSA